MNWATFRIAPPANCRFSNLAGLMHTSGVSPVPIFGGMTGFQLAEASSAYHFLDSYLNGHLGRAWGLGLPWHTVSVSAGMTGPELACTIRTIEPRQEEGVLVGMAMPMNRVAHRKDVAHEVYERTGGYHYVLRCVRAPNAVTTIDATPTRQTPAPFVLEGVDTLDSLLGGEPYDLFLDRPWDIVLAIQERNSLSGNLLAEAIATFRADLAKRVEGEAPTLGWIARRWAASPDESDDYFSPHLNVFRVLAEHRAFVPDLIRAAARVCSETATVLHELTDLQSQYDLLARLSLKLHLTKSHRRRAAAIAAGSRILEDLLVSEQRWAGCALEVTG